MDAVTEDEIRPILEVLPSPPESNITSPSGNEEGTESAAQSPLATNVTGKDPADAPPDSLRSILEGLVGELGG